MRKGKSVIGKEVVSLATGQRIQAVKDVVIGDDSRQIVALLVDEGGLLGTSTVVPIESVESFGRDAVVITDNSAVVPASKAPRVAAILGRKDSLIGKKVYTETGDDQGKIADVYFDEETGAILGFEVSQGLAGDLASGTSFLSQEEVTRVGPDLVYIRPETAGALDEQVGGIRGAMQDAGQKAGELAGGAKAQAGALVEQARAGSPDGGSDESLIGRRAGTEVTDESGRTVVARGQRITAQHVERARATGNLEVLKKSASQGQAEERGEQASNSIAGAGDAVGSAWDRFTAKLRDVTDAAGQRVDEQQTRKRLSEIADAIGRPVTKVILDRQDNVVLNVGDIITHQAVQQAHDNGQLDSLLANVYTAEITLPPQQLRVPLEASATADKASGGAVLVEELEQKVQSAEQEREQRNQESRQQSDEARQQREEERRQRAQERDQQAQQLEAERQAALATAQTPSTGGPAPAPQPARPGSQTTVVTG